MVQVNHPVAHHFEGYLSPRRRSPRGRPWGGCNLLLEPRRPPGKWRDCRNRYASGRSEGCRRNANLVRQRRPVGQRRDQGVGTGSQGGRNRASIRLRPCDRRGEGCRARAPINPRRSRLADGCKWLSDDRSIGRGGRSANLVVSDNWPKGDCRHLDGNWPKRTADVGARLRRSRPAASLGCHWSSVYSCRGQASFAMSACAGGTTCFGKRQRHFCRDENTGEGSTGMLRADDEAIVAEPRRRARYPGTLRRRKALVNETRPDRGRPSGKGFPSFLYSSRREVSQPMHSRLVRIEARNVPCRARGFSRACGRWAPKRF